MRNILVINSSVSGDASVSRLLVDKTIEAIKQRNPAAKIVQRDVGEQPIPHLTRRTLAGVRGVAQSRLDISTDK